MSRSGSVKKFEFLRPFRKATEKLKKSCFAFCQLYIEPENKKFVDNTQQCFAFTHCAKIQMLTTSCQILTSLGLWLIKSLGL